MENQLTATIVHLEKGNPLMTESQSYIQCMNTSRLNRLDAGSLSSSVQLLPGTAAKALKRDYLSPQARDTFLEGSLIGDTLSVTKSQRGG